MGLFILKSVELFNGEIRGGGGDKVCDTKPRWVGAGRS